MQCYLPLVRTKSLQYSAGVQFGCTLRVLSETLGGTDVEFRGGSGVAGRG